MYGPYRAVRRDGVKQIDYIGNNVYSPQENIAAKTLSENEMRGRVRRMQEDKGLYHLHRIDDGVFKACVEYFISVGAEWCNLPLTTLMISSPGEVYAGKVLDYTSDTLPVELSWFDADRNIYLAESSQFYLELRLLIDQVNKVFSIYNSFRKEKADFSHLSEFQHIEFEGKISFGENINTFLGLLRAITKYVVKHHEESLQYFLSERELRSLDRTFESGNIATITFSDALRMLKEETNDPTYDEFSMRHFGSWEEVKLTEILGKHVIVTGFPLMQIPFYHNAKKDNQSREIAENADLVLFGYRETVGSGCRITDKEALRHKARVFNLPEEDYAPYLEMRDFASYRSTAGFGLGWQRYTQWLLKLPFIWEAAHIPRSHLLPRP